MTVCGGGEGRGFKPYENRVGAAVVDTVNIRGDGGYQRILRFHRNRETPRKKPKGGELTVAEK
ncbi:hypothetical protein FACS1894139_10300 [Planctomycetales bacterium]|nr:hypothetical protein FACS1894107_14930 [Planctomycetales bacterium]GHS97810.1 hypothetical protein FACS1894108_04820 [Planctomycetales bacterium]GHT05805.1 hypothetical protein FACS1894139_10300 [Planctomycetales bacterium]